MFTLSSLFKTVLKSIQFCRIFVAVMANFFSLTVKDVCQALGGVSRSRIHAWTRLPPFSAVETSERSARKFNVADVLTLAALKKLEDVYGVRSRHLGLLSAGIHLYLAEPKTAGSHELLFVRLNDGIARSLDVAPVTEPGWVLDIAEERERMNLFLGISSPQRELSLMVGMPGRAS